MLLQIDGEPVLGIVAEAQLQSDPQKRFTWPVYVAGLRARFKCPACVLAVTAREAMTEWCREPIVLGPGNVFTTLVVARHRCRLSMTRPLLSATPNWRCRAASHRFERPEPHLPLAAGAR